MRRTFRRSRATSIAVRVGTVATAAALLVGVGAGTAQAAMRTNDVFSWATKDVKRLANCAATEWYNNSKVGDAITTCGDAGSNSHWDEERLVAASELTIDGRKVAHRGDRACPPKRGVYYVKCFYVHGKRKGNPVMTVSVLSSGLGGMDVAVDWYYL